LLDKLTGSVSHVAVYSSVLSSARILAHAAGRNLTDTETSGAAINRLASYAGLTTAEVDATSTNTVALFNPAGSTAIDAMRKVELTESGVLFDGLDGVLTLNSRSHRYNAATSFTLDAAHGAVGGALFPTLDDLGQLNDVTVTNNDGIIAHVTDATSIAADGYYKTSLDILETGNYVSLERASWETYKNADPQTRVAEIEVLLNNADATVTAGVLNAEPGTKLLLTGLPSNAPASSMYLFVEGRSETIGASEDRIVLRTSPTTAYNIIVVDDATSGFTDSTTYVIGL
jgi:hypothetical protein